MMETRTCIKCDLEHPADCFRKNRKDCVWCQFEDPSFRAKHRFRDKLKAKRWAVDFDEEGFVEWYCNEPDQCHYCGTTFEDLRRLRLRRFKGRYVSWDIDRIDSFKPYALGNVVLSCFICNTAKGNWFDEAEARRVGQAVRANLQARLKKT